MATKASEILRELTLAKGKTPQDSARVAQYYDTFMNTPGITYPLKEKAFMDSFGSNIPYEFDEVKVNAELPTIEAIVTKLGYKNDDKEMKNGRSAVQKFLEDFPKDIKKKAREINDLKEEWGDEGWEYVKKAWQQASIDKMNADINAGYEKKLLEGDSKMSLPLVGDVDLGEAGKAISSVGSRAMQFFTPRRYEAISRGDDPTLADNVGDAIESGLMAIPAGQYAKILGYVPKVGKALKANKFASNVFGNAFAPFAGEFMDDAMRGEDDPNTERQDWSIGDALMGAATNLGVNFGLARGFGGLTRTASGELTRGGSVGKVRKMLEDIGKSRSERGLGPALPRSIAKNIPIPASVILDAGLDAAGSAAPTLFVNRYGKDRDADLAFNMAGFAIPGGASILGVGGAYGMESVKDIVKKTREEEHQKMKDRKTNKEVKDVIKASDVLGLNKRDVDYLNAVADDPSIVYRGYANDPDDFKLWLLERGHKLLENTGAHRPLWEVK